MKIVNTYNKLKCLYVMKSPFFHSSATERVKYVVVVDRRAGQKYGQRVEQQNFRNERFEL